MVRQSDKYEWLKSTIAHGFSEDRGALEDIEEFLGDPYMIDTEDIGSLTAIIRHTKLAYFDSRYGLIRIFSHFIDAVEHRVDTLLANARRDLILAYPDATDRDLGDFDTYDAAVGVLIRGLDAILKDRERGGVPTND